MKMKDSTVKRPITALLASAGALALILSGCSAGGGNDSGAAKTDLTLAASYGPDSLDPSALSAGGEGFYFWQPVYDTLVKMQPDGTFGPGLATEWEYDEAQTTLTLGLREGVTFVDGAEFNADAAKANIDRFQATPGLNSARGEFIESVDVVDPDTIAINLSAVDPSLLQALAGPVGAMASPDALDNEDLDVNPVGSGGYVLDTARTTAGAEYVFTRRDAEYWDADSWAFDTITVKVVPDVTARVNGLMSGEFDGAAVTPASGDQIESAGQTLLSSPAGFFGMGIFDRAGTIQPALADLRVRQAINYAFDRDALLQAIQGGNGAVSQQLFGPGLEGYDESLDDTYSYDVEKARELMAEAGYADGFEVSIPDMGQGGAAPALLQDAMAAIGIRVVYVPTAPTEIFQALFGGQYPMFLMGQAGTTWNQISGMLLPDSTWNMLHSTDPELTALLDAARVATPDQRQDAYAAVNKWAIDNAWFAVIYQQNDLYALQSDVTAQVGVANNVPLTWTFAPAE